MDDRKHVLEKVDGCEWKKFTPESRADAYKVLGAEPETKPSFEETMTIDTIKAMRRDRRAQAKSKLRE